MKKTIAIFFLCCSLSLFAETGYRGYKWYSNKNDFPKTGRLDTSKITGWEDILIYKKQVLEEPNFLYYGFTFDDEEFIDAGYVIQNDKTPELKKQLKEKIIKEIKVELGDLDEQLAEAKITDEEAREYGEKEDNHFFYDQLSWIALMLERNGTGDIEEGPGLLTIYDYNNDTRIYLFEGAVTGKTVVVYVPHEQDY